MTAAWAAFFDQLDLASLLREQWYAQEFAPLKLPYVRNLICPICRVVVPLRVILEILEYDYRFKDFEHHACCRNCGMVSIWEVEDVPPAQESHG